MSRTSAFASRLVTLFFAASQAAELPYPSASCPRSASNVARIADRAAANFALIPPIDSSTPPAEAPSRASRPSPLRKSIAASAIRSASATLSGT
jgi:hypothetical protein